MTAVVELLGNDPVATALGSDFVAWESFDAALHKH